MVYLRGMVHGTRVKIMVRLHNYGTVWKRCGRLRSSGVDFAAGCEAVDSPR